MDKPGKIRHNKQSKLRRAWHENAYVDSHNEFAQTQFRYGAQPGVYTQTLTDTLYYKLHEITLNGLITGKTYYYRFSHTDRSGNLFQSGEYRFVVNVSVYLPLVKK
jgi:hypothetical protein